jgi:hypothetical protein
MQFEQEIAGSETGFSINATSLIPGIYLLQVTSGNHSEIKKFIISR